MIAIDGPAGAGKSTIAKALAARLAFDHLDTGAMYRAVAYAALRDGVDPADTAAVGALLGDLRIEVGERVIVDGDDATGAIRGAAVTAAVTPVAANPAVRAELTRRQRRWAEDRRGVVVEGRDIGSVVFPDAALKLYLTASARTRAERRVAQSGGDVDAVEAAIAYRDERDRDRADGPLVRAAGATVVDTTGRSVDEVLDEIERLAAAAGIALGGEHAGQEGQG